MTTLTTRQTFALIALFVVTSFTFIQLDNRQALDPVKTGAHSLLLPVTRVFNRVADGRANDSDAQRQLDDLRRQNAALQAENAQLKVKADQVDQLSAQLNLKKDHPTWKTVQARVINPDPTNLQKFITIDKGAKDGIAVGMAVVDPNFFVGQVTAVTETTARVTLVIDESQQIGARLLDGGADGIVYGQWQQGGRLVMRHVSRDTQPKDGEAVITSTNSATNTANVPGNLIIGRVSGPPVLDRQNDSLVIQVLPAANFDNLKVVTVILADVS